MDSEGQGKFDLVEVRDKMIHILELLLDVLLLEVEIEALWRLSEEPGNLARLDYAILLEIINHERHLLNQFLPYCEQGCIVECEVALHEKIVLRHS
jgi:hypothetical protein